MLRVDELQTAENQVVLGDIIAEGTYGTVHKGKHVETGDVVAIKIVTIVEGNHAELQEELKVLRNMSVDQRIPKFYGIFKSQQQVGNDQVWFVMEFCDGGTVSSLCQRVRSAGDKVGEEFIAYVLHHLVQVLCHLHRNHFIHRDVRGSNILLTQQGLVKLVDFGTTLHLKSTMDRCGVAVGAPYWMAPEVIMCDQQADADYDNRSDVWSTGITAIELADGYPPLWDVQPVQAMFQIARNPPPLPAKPSEWSQTFIDFLSECLERQMEHRPVMDEVAQHPFVAQIATRQSQLQTSTAALLAKYPSEDRQPATPCLTTRNGYLRSSRHQNPQKILIDDLVAMDSPTLDKCAELLSTRFRQNIFYTFVADILLAVNPFCQEDQHMYDQETHRRYSGKSRSDNPPHIFSVADKAVQDALHYRTGQSIVFTGESGAGKTHNATMALKHMCHVGRNESVGAKLLAASWLVHMLGSCSCSVSDHSTRHICLTEVTFTKTGRLSGAIYQLYMLHSDRLTDTPKGEGSFNALYAYFYGLKQAGRLGIYRLSNSQEYRVLPKHRRMDEAVYGDQFRQLEEKLELLEISRDCQETVRKMMAAIILLAEVQFAEHEERVCVTDRATLSTVAFLLSIDEAKLEWSLCNECCHLDGKTVKQRRCVSSAEACRDSTVQLLYCRLVDSVVNWINAAFTLTRLVFGETHSVNLLDMTGFGTGQCNGLSQLTVNAFNEQINCFFQQSVFVWEMEDYQNDGLEMEPFQYTSNAAAIGLLMSKQSGLFALLDLASLTHNGDDDTFVDACRNEISSDYFSTKGSDFSIAHFKGTVKYTAHGLVQKNKDHCSSEMVATLSSSENPLLVTMFTVPLTRTGNLAVDTEKAQKEAGKAGKKSPRATAHNKRFDTRSRGRLSQTDSVSSLTAGGRYRYSAMEVLHKLVNSSCQFVHCISSNSDAAPLSWQNELVSRQLRSVQIMNTIQIRKHGFPQRTKFGEFLRRYKFLAFDYDENVEVTADNCRLLLIRLKMDGFMIGRERVFLKYFSEEFMNRLYEREVKKIAKIQAAVRAFLVRRRKKSGRSVLFAAPPASEYVERRRRSVTTELLLTSVAQLTDQMTPPEEMELSE